MQVIKWNKEKTKWPKIHVVQIVRKQRRKLTGNHFLEKVIKESFISAKGTLEISLGIIFGEGYKCKQYMYFRNQKVRSFIKNEKAH